MRYLPVLLLGLILGYSVGHRPVPPPPVHEECPTNNDNHAGEASSPHPIPIAKVVALPPKILNMKPVERTVASEPPRRPRQITVTSQMVAKLEMDWNNLPQQVRLMRENEGWRVIVLQANSLFAELGLKEGDLITNVAVESLGAGQPDADLPVRFSNILRQVTR
jgi:hypothetical protein